MKIKTSLFFRSFKQKTIKEKPYIECKFLDDEDKSYIFLFELNEDTQKYLKMAKDTKVDLTLNLYEPTDNKYKKYALWVV